MASTDRTDKSKGKNTACEAESVRLDDKAISKACVQHAWKHLREELSTKPSQSAVGELFDVKQPMVKMVMDGRRAFSLEKITKYVEHAATHRSGKTQEERIGSVFLELTELAAEEQGVRPVKSPAQDEPAFLEEVCQATTDVYRDVLRDGHPADWAAEQAYQQALVHSFDLFGECTPVKAVALAFYRAGSWRFLAANDSSRDQKTAPCPWVALGPPRPFIEALKRCGDAWDAGTPPEAVVTRPPEEGTERDVNAFWERLTSTEGGLIGTKLRMYAEPVLDAAGERRGQGSTGWATWVVFLFEYRFQASDNERRAMAAVADAMRSVHARELWELARTMSSLAVSVLRTALAPLPLGATEAPQRAGRARPPVVRAPLRSRIPEDASAVRDEAEDSGAPLKLTFPRRRKRRDEPDTAR